MRLINPISGLKILLLLYSGAACSNPESNLQLEINQDVPDSLLFEWAVSTSEKLEFRAPWHENGKLRLSTENAENNFQNVLIEIGKNRQGNRTILEMSFYKPNWKGTLKPVSASPYDFYRQAFQQEIDPDAFKDGREFAFQEKSPGVAYGLAATLPEALPFYLKNGDFELHDPNVWAPEFLVFLMGDLGAMYFLLDDEWMPAQKLFAVSGFAVTRLLGLIFTNYHLKRNKALVRSGYKYKK